MGIMAGIRESVTTLREESSQLSLQVKENFLKHAQKDESTGELYMTENGFIDAIAPLHEDYVSLLPTDSASLVALVANCG